MCGRTCETMHKGLLAAALDCCLAPPLSARSTQCVRTHDVSVGQRKAIAKTARTAPDERDGFQRGARLAKEEEQARTQHPCARSAPGIACRARRQMAELPARPTPPRQWITALCPPSTRWSSSFRTDCASAMLSGANISTIGSRRSCNPWDCTIFA